MELASLVLMVSLVIDGRPACVVETGDRATATEVHAAEELASYLKRMSGAKVPIGGPGGGDRVVIGTPATSSRVRALVERGLVTLSADVPGHDGFIVRTLKDGDHNVLVIASMVPRGCLHGVYHLLETQLRVGFFWDGEQVPRRDTIRLTDLNLVERPDFGEREYLQACAYGYTAMFWTIDEWKRELDWAARKKFNLVQINWGNAVPLFHALKSMGVEGLTPPTPWEEHETQLAVAIHRHCRKLGLRVIGPAFDGRVPPEVRKAFPGARYVAVQWLDLPPKFPIAPSDPLFVRIGAQFIREHIKLCGTDHFYNTDPYPETDPGATEQEKRSVKVDFAKALVASIRAADPEGTWIISGWGMGWGNTWDEQDVEAFLQVIPDDMFVVNDIWAERNPIYERFSYFHGKRWGFSVLHSMGGWTTPHGDLADLIRRMQAVRADPKADHCTNFYLNPEILNQNDVYIDLAANLSWRSTDVTVDAFLDDYLVRRYGPDAGMRKCWDALLESVYAHYDYTAPAYQTRPTLKVPESYGKLRHAYIPHLADALRAALAQASQLADNNFFQRDVVDMARQYVAEVFNLHFARLVAAFEAGDADALEKEAANLGRCFDGLEKMLSSHLAFSIRPEHERARHLPKYYSLGYDAGNKLAGNGQLIRMRYTALAGIEHYPTLIDYPSNDRYELVRHYYRPRFNLYLDHLRAKLKAGEPFDFDDLDQQYLQIVRRFVETPLPPGPPAEYLGDPCRAAREVLAELVAQP